MTNQEMVWEFFATASAGEEYAISHGFGTDGEAQRHCERLNEQGVVSTYAYRPAAKNIRTSCDLSGLFQDRR